MTLFSLITALLLEQLRPLFLRKHLYGWLFGYVESFQQHFNAGEYSHGKTAWWLAVLPMLAGGVLVFRGLFYLHPVLAWMFNVLALYLCMGFGQFSHGFADIQQALLSGKPDEAREILSALRGRDSQELNPAELNRVTVEVSLLGALHHLFGVIVWFVLFSLVGLGGAAGALFYCLVLALGKYWVGEFDTEASSEAKFNVFARKMSVRVTWLPVRLTALTFAVVGQFEDAVYCWRSQAASWPDSEAGIVLASAAGASGVRLGIPTAQDGERPELGVGDKTGEAVLHSAKQLLWRSVVFMLVVLFMLTLAGLLR